MNYRHLYHAGNFADVVKHCVLLALLEALKRKPKPFCVLDTHAGIGEYHLLSEETQKKQEYQTGISKLLIKTTETIPELITQYLAIVQQHNVVNKLAYYPGSPLVIASAIREEDRLIANELHPDDAETLKVVLNAYRNADAHHINGYHAMKAFLPPKENRGLVLIDPPFENTTEYDDIIAAMKPALKHWRGGTYAIWYPIKNRSKVKNFYKDLISLNFPLMLIEFTLKNIENESALNSFGLAIINPPWLLPELLTNEILPYLATALECDWSVRTENHQ